jgi:exonuclease III
MKIATFNVNGINGRLPRVLEWLEEAQPDVACLQELKTSDETFPALAIQAAGYQAVWHGQKGFNGVAVLARGGNPSDAQAMSTAMLQGLEALPPAQIDQWFEISLKATDAQLSNTPPQTVAPADVQAAMNTLISSLPADQQQRLLKVLPQMAQANDEDACWAARTLYKQTLATKEPVRGQLAWVFAQQ